MEQDLNKMELKDRYIGCALSGKRLKFPAALRWLALSAESAFGMFLLWWILSQVNFDISRLAQRLAQVSTFPLVLAILCFVVVMSLGTLRYSLFLSADMSHTYLFGITLLQNALLTFVPWRIGEASFPLLMRRYYDIPVARSSVYLLTIRLADFVIVVAVALAGGSRLGVDLGIAVLLLIAFGVALAAFWIVLLKWRSRLPGSFRGMAIFDSPGETRINSIVLLSIGIFLFTTFQSVFTLNAVGLNVPVIDVALLNALTLLVAILPIHPPGGWGTVDSVQIYILSYLGFDPNTTIITILSAHSLYTALILVGGIVGWVLCLKGRSLQKVGR